MANSANRNHVAGISAQSYTQYGVVQEPHAISAENPMIGVSEIQEIAKKLFKLQLEHTQNRALNIEVIEDTLLIDASIVGKRKFRKKKRQEREKKKKKKQRRKKRVYSREELEVLRFDNLDGQKKTWAAVYGGLRPTVAAEYDGLLASTSKNHGVSSSRFDCRPHFDPAAAMGRRNRQEYICALKNC
ncbi:hypothetical protein ACS0TY_023913 [Phlomoides rotata]